MRPDQAPRELLMPGGRKRGGVQGGKEIRESSIRRAVNGYCQLGKQRGRMASEIPTVGRRVELQCS